MTVYAREVDSQATFSVHVDGASRFELPVPAPGQYIVFGWTDAGAFTPDSLGGTFSCMGMFVGQMGYLGKGGVDLSCPDQEDHTPLSIEVDPGEVFEDIYLCDFYSPESVPAP